MARSLENEQYITLPELVVTPAAWQIDYKKNFGNKKIRKQILNDIETNYKRAMVINPNTRKPEYIWDEDNNETNAITERLYNIWNEGGRPSLTNKNSFINYISGNIDRPNYNPIFNRAYAINNIYDAISEISHPIRDKYSKRGKWYHYLADTPKTIYGELFNNQSQYDDDNHYEGETHNIVQPELEDYILTGKPTKYVRKSLKD